MRALVLALGVFAAGCGARRVTVAPASAPPVQDDFFATWQIVSGTYGTLECGQIGGATVDLDIVNADSGERFIYSFPCAAYQGTSGAVDVGRFDVLINLTDAGGGVIAQVDVGAQNVSTAGTIDLGHVVFSVP